jgi:hypothetical protein
MFLISGFLPSALERGWPRGRCHAALGMMSEAQLLRAKQIVHKSRQPILALFLTIKSLQKKHAAVQMEICEVRDYRRMAEESFAGSSSGASTASELLR